MKITFEGATRVLDLGHITLKQGIAIQGYTGLTVHAWQERVAGVSALDAAMGGDPLTEAAKKGDGAAVTAMLRKSPMYTDPAWIMSVAAAHWLMLAQAGEDPPPLDDEYDCDVLGFYLAFMTAFAAEAKAQRVPDRPGPTVRSARRTPSSRRTAGPSPLTSPSAGPLPLTGS